MMAWNPFAKRKTSSDPAQPPQARDNEAAPGAMADGAQDRVVDGTLPTLPLPAPEAHGPDVPDAVQQAQSDDKARGPAGRLRAWRRRKATAKPAALPIRVVIGYLPEVTERDAREYAVGIAEKHFEQISLAYFDAFPYANGFAFEAHEGGNGKAFLPEILEYFESQGPYRNEEEVQVNIRTATRVVQVLRTRDGLAAVILPEDASADTPATPWLNPTTSMMPAVNTRTGFLIVGAALFTTGFVAMMVTSMLTRFQPYEPPPAAKVEYLRADQLPVTQWRNLSAVPSDSFVNALRYRNGRWEQPEITREETPSSATAEPASLAPGLPPTPALSPEVNNNTTGGAR